MRRHSLILLAAATIGLAASQASAAEPPEEGSCLRSPAATAGYLDRMLHRRQHRRRI